MNVLRFTVIDAQGVISFVAPWNVLKALTAACSTKPAPQDFVTLIEAASKYDTGLKKYIFDNLSIFDENHAKLNSAEEETSELNPLLEKQLEELLANKYQTSGNQNKFYQSAFGEVVRDEVSGEDVPETEASVEDAGSLVEDENAEITYEELGRIQRDIVAKAEAYHPVFRVTDAQTREKSQEPAGAGLIIFNLKAKRIIQVQNSFSHLRSSDRGRYHEDGKPTERLYFYRLPSDWHIVP